MRKPKSAVAARFNERLQATKKTSFPPESQRIKFLSMSGETTARDKQLQKLANRSFERHGVLHRIEENLDEEDDEITKNPYKTAKKTSASPSIFLCDEEKNHFRKSPESKRSTENWSPTNVEDFECAQPQLSTTPPQTRFGTTLKPRNLYKSWSLDGKGKLPCTTSLSQRTRMPKTDIKEDVPCDDFQDAVQDEEPVQSSQSPSSENHEECFVDAHQESPAGGKAAMKTKVTVSRSNGDDDCSISAPVAELNPAARPKKKEETAYDWSSIKSQIVHGFRSHSAYFTESVLACQQPPDSTDSLSPLDGANKDAEKSIVSGFDSLRRSFSSFSLGGMSTTTFWDGDTKNDSQATKDTKGAPQVPTQGQDDKFALQDDSSSKVVLYIDHYGPSTFFRLMKDLKNNDRIKELHIFRSWNDDIKRSRNKADICILFDAIRTLPRLVHLALSNFFPEELDHVTACHWHNPHMISLRIHVCKGALSRNLLKTLAGIPELQNLALEVCRSAPFHYLLKNEKLQTLSLAGNDFTWQHEHIIELVYNIRKNSTLKRLSLEPTMHIKTFKFLAYGLGANTGMEDLRVNVLPGNTSVETNEAIQELSRTLAINTSLKSVWNTNYDALKVNDQVSKKLLDAIAKNDALQEFLMFEEEPAFHCAKQTLLKDNRQSSVPILPDFYIPGCSAAESIRNVVTTKDPNNDILSLVDSVAMDYAAMGSSILRLGGSFVATGKNMLGLVWNTAAVMGQVTASKSPSHCDTNTSADEITTSGIESTFSGSTVTA